MRTTLTTTNLFRFNYFKHNCKLLMLLLLLWIRLFNVIKVV